MQEQYGTITVREARLTRAEVEQIIAENLKLRGPSGYEFDYSHPVMFWADNGSLVVRFASRDMREEAGRAPSSLRMMPWAEFIRRQAAELERASKPAAPAAAPAAVKDAT